MVQAVDAGIGRQRQHLNELRCAESIADAIPVLRIGKFYGAGDLAVKLVSGGRVRGVDGQVRDAGDPGARQGFVWQLSGSGDGKEDKKSSG